MYINKKIKYVFLITIDSLRADKVGFIGGGNLTPNIDKIAKNSIQFLKAFSNGPGTNQSFPAIMTSTYFLMHNSFHLSPNTKTLAMILNQNGFKTVAFHSNPFLSKTFGWNLGYDEYYDYLETIKSPSSFITKQQGDDFKKKIFRFFIKNSLFKNTYIIQLLKNIYYKFSGLEIPYLEANMLVNNVINWIKNNTNNTFFVWMHFMDPHFPYVPPKRYLKNFKDRKEAFNFNISKNPKYLFKENLTVLKELYEGEVKYVDSCIGKLMEYLTKNGYIENSLIFIVSDHGEAFMEHDKFGHTPDIMYNEVIHVPLLIFGLGEIKIIDSQVQLLDVSPTLFDILNIKKPTSFVGESLLLNKKNINDWIPIFLNIIILLTEKKMWRLNYLL